MPVSLSECLAGKSGEGLAAVLRRECRPATLDSYGNISYTFHDPFIGADVTISDGKFPSGYAAGTLVPYKWWLETDLYGDTLRYDLNNFIPLTIDVLHSRGDNIPCELAEITERYDSWAVGHALRFGSMVDAYAPPMQMRGRLARAFFYMAVMYPNKVFTPTAYMMMSDSYPYLLADAAEMLARWNAQYPPDEAERDWMRYAAVKQGGCNPFVEIEDLYDYIWGDKSGEIYGGSGERIPLHSTYNLIDGDRIELYSPYVPDDAVWSVDGLPAESQSYEARELGEGRHTLTYTSASKGEKGCVMIKVVNESRRSAL